MVGKQKSGIFFLNLFAGLYFICSLSLNCQEKLPDSKITIDVKDEKYSKVLEIIENKSGYKFCYNNGIIPQDNLVTINTKGISLWKLLTALFKASNLDYKIINGQIAIIKSKAISQSEVNSDIPVIAIKDRKNVDKSLNQERTIVYDTIVTTIYDTLKLPVHDTLHLHDTILIRQFDTLVYSFKNKKNKLLVKYERKLEISAGSFIPVTNVLFASAPQYKFIADSLTHNSSYRLSYLIGGSYIYSYERYLVFAGLSFSYFSEQLQYFDKRETYFLNRYYFINAPILFGYKFRIKNNFSTELLGGLNIHWLLLANTKIFQSNDSGYTISSAPRSYYSGFTYSWLGGGSLNFKFSKRIEAFGRMMLQVPIRSLYSNEFYISRFQTYLILSCGLNYSLK